jgi:hypothetical protein
MRKVYKQDCYKVYNTATKRVFAKCTTKDKAMRQLAIIRNKVYTAKSPTKSKTMRTTTVKHNKTK